MMQFWASQLVLATMIAKSLQNCPNSPIYNDGGLYPKYENEPQCIGNGTDTIYTSSDLDINHEMINYTHPKHHRVCALFSKEPYCNSRGFAWGVHDPLETLKSMSNLVPLFDYSTDTQQDCFDVRSIVLDNVRRCRLTIWTEYDYQGPHYDFDTQYLVGLYGTFLSDCLSFSFDVLADHMARVNEKGFPNNSFTFATDCNNGVEAGFKSYVCSCIGDPWVQQMDKEMQEEERRFRARQDL